MRKPVQEGDINPLIIDIVDNLSCFKTWGDQRIKYYGTKKYSINTYKAFNQNIISYKQFLINENEIDINELSPDFDCRKEFIIQKYGEDTYKFESKIGFANFPDSMFNYECNFDEIFEINHKYVDRIEQNIEIELSPIHQDE